MPSALWLLLWLNIRAGFRRIGRRAGTVRGVVFAVLGLAVVGAWLLPVLFMRPARSANGVAALRETAPAAILLYCALNVFASAGDRAVTFSAAEVDFLFPGPFSRRQLLAYKLVKTGIGGIVNALIFSRILLRYNAAYWSGVVGIWLTLLFAQLVAMVVALLRTTISERVFSRGRHVALLALLAAVAVAVGPYIWSHRDMGPSAIAHQLHGSTVGRCLLAPFDVYARAITADRLLPDALPWDAAAIAIIAALIAAVLLLDANYLETAATASARRYARVSRVRRVGLAGTAHDGSAKLRVPQLPWLAGAGPIAWRQLTGVLRTGRGLLTVIVIVAFAGGGAVAHADRDPDSLLSLALVTLGVTLFLSSLLKFDFRGDLDHLDVLRALPLRPSAVAVGELVAPTLVLSLVQAVLLVATAIWGKLPGSWVAVAGAYMLPINAVLVGSENLLFLLFPAQQETPVAGDMGMVGRRAIGQLCRVLFVLVVGGTCVATGAAAWAATRQSMAAALVASWLPLPCTIVALVALTGLVYDRFDPSVDRPT